MYIQRSLKQVRVMYSTCTVLTVLGSVMGLAPFAGQYQGHSKPLPEYHVKISGFDSKVGVMWVFCVYRYASLVHWLTCFDVGAQI